MAKFLVVQLAVEDFVVGLLYLCRRDYARCVYWWSAGTITLSSLFIGRG